MNVIIGFSNVLPKVASRSNNIRTIKESGNTVINRTVDITKTDARKMTLRISLNLSNAATPLPLLDIRYYRKNSIIVYL
jgi:hypothetical protein